jgi:hypothetical protein
MAMYVSAIALSSAAVAAVLLAAGVRLAAGLRDVEL